MGFTSLNLTPLMIRCDYAYRDPSFQVGAAISMTYTTGQPIVFVGTGQTYKLNCSYSIIEFIVTIKKSKLESNHNMI